MGYGKEIQESPENLPMAKSGTMQAKLYNDIIHIIAL